MSRKDPRPPLGGIDAIEDDLARIREFGLSRGFLPTDPPALGNGAYAAPPQPAPQPPPQMPPQPPAPEPVLKAPDVPPPVVIRPAPTKPWQAMLPDYLIDELRQAAAKEGTAQKVVVMRALRDAGFRVDEIDLQDLRRR